MTKPACCDHLPARSARLLMALVLCCCIDGFAGSLMAAEPLVTNAVHLGVASCAASTCHGGIEAAHSGSILGNEFVTWTRRDAHARAYATLQSARSQAIAAKLGLQSAVSAKICLDCHADNVPAAQRGPDFQLSDGVGCEACHGGAQHWLASHASGQASHRDNIKAGLYPTDAPAARAQLCLSCHFGGADKFVSHRLMGAGHPRLSFELDTFTALQPAHFRNDADYQRRKAVGNDVHVWAVGQVGAVERFLDTFIKALDDRRGLFPELVFFDCYACHHPMREQRWQRQALVGLGPGMVRLNDAHFLMLRHIVKTMDDRAGTRLTQQIRALHQATADSYLATRTQAIALRAEVATLAPQVAAYRFDRAAMRTLLDAIIDEGQHGEDQDYVAAEQATMAIATLATALAAAGELSAAQTAHINQALQPLYDAVQHDERYRPADFTQALRRVRASVPR